MSESVATTMSTLHCSVSCLFNEENLSDRDDVDDVSGQETLTPLSTGTVRCFSLNNILTVEWSVSAGLIVSVST